MRSEPGVRRVIEAEVAEVDRACAELRAGLLRELGDAERFAIELLLREALTNAIFHGACGPRAGGIEYEVRLIEGGVLIRVADGGRGFDWTRRRGVGEEVLEEHGLGIEILHRYANQVRFFGNGSEVELVRALPGGPDV